MIHLLKKERVDGFLTDGLADELVTIELLQEQADLPGTDHITQPAAGCRSIKELPGELRLLHAHPTESILCARDRAVIDQLVCCGVVADGNHQPAKGAHVYLHIIREESQRAANRHLVRLGDQQLFVHGHPASYAFCHHMHVQRQLDHAGSAEYIVCPHAEFTTCDEVLIIKARMPGNISHLPGDPLKNLHFLFSHNHSSFNINHNRSNHQAQSGRIVLLLHFVASDNTL